MEWQFYIIYPILLLLLSKFFSIKALKKIVIYLTIVLFLYGWYSSVKDSVSSYYMLQSRAWEMLLGGIAYFYPLKLKKTTRVLIYYSSLVVLIASAFFINHKDLWPGYLAIIPAVMTYLVIVCSVEKGILASKVLQYIGLISYSVYLVHWPILVIANKLALKLGFIYYVLITLVLASQLYYFVERKRSYGLTVVFIYMLAIAASIYVLKNGVSSRVNPDFQLSRNDYKAKFEGHLNLPQSMDAQYFNGNVTDFDFILIGNSHARHFFSYIKKHGIKVASLALDGCTSTKNYYSFYNKKSVNPDTKWNLILLMHILKSL
ncbi:hypothetical protein QE177_07730 [Arsenophonus sp. aPb]|uniref:acyltransferase family protein n=1 Tax=Arsenophonus sp. aPb TaxID=3041619 RepID=UPI002468E3B1|nr:acyltransferase family protein [Arsenophonus sp. aPb]WGL97129.1 hypothetical protein QE177_07730 [Arsenophonus sp. aPb]